MNDRPSDGILKIAENLYDDLCSDKKKRDVDNIESVTQYKNPRSAI